MAKQKLAIHLRNIRECQKLFIKHPIAWYNQIYKPSYKSNENKDRVYNQIYTSKS